MSKQPSDRPWYRANAQGQPRHVQRDMFDSVRTSRPPDGWTPTMLPELRGEKLMCIDAETNGLDWWDKARAVGWAWFLPESGRSGYTAFGHKGGGNVDKCHVDEWFRRNLRNLHIENINTKFDAHIARAGGCDWVEQGNTLGDVAHRAALLDDHRFRFGLDQLAEDFLGPDEGKYNLGLADKGNLWELPAWEVEPYAIQDVVLVHRLMEAMQPDIDAQELGEVLALEQAIIPVVVEMETNGAWLNMSLLQQWVESIEKRRQELVMRIWRDTGVMLTSPDSPKDLARIFQKLGIVNTKLTKSGKMSFTGEILKRAAEHYPTIAQVLEVAQLADLDSKYTGKYSKTVRADGWIRFNLHQLRVGRDEDDKYGTVSGRFSSAGDDLGGFNIQQVVSPDKQKRDNWCVDYPIRNLFLPEPGTECLSVDADQIEYRIFAHFANDPEILAAYNEDVSHLTDDEAREQKRGKYTDYHDKVQIILKRAKPDIQRKKTKITNFCKLFGAALIKFAWTLETITDEQFQELDDKYSIHRWKKAKRGAREEAIRREPILQEALEIFDLYDNEFPAAKRTLDAAKKQARDYGFVRTLLKRRARFPGGQRSHSALNRAVQGTAADINKRVLVELFKVRKALALRLRATVHDEVVSDMGDRGLLPQIMSVFNTQWYKLRVPILWSEGYGPSWGQAKGKA